MLSEWRDSFKRSAVKLLLGLLVLTFVVWGVGDFAVKSDVALKIGDLEVSKAELRKFYSMQMSHLVERYGSIDRAQEPLLQRIFLKQFIDNALLNQEAKRLKIESGDDIVRHEILRNMPHFTKDGKFNGELLSDFLKNTGMSELAFVNEVKAELARKNLSTVIASGIMANKILLKQIVTSLFSKREVEIFEADANKFTMLAQPSEEDLRRILKNHEERFNVPERRKVSFLRLQVKESGAQKVLDDEIESFYKEKSYLFAVPEKRNFLRLIVNDEKEALKLREKLLNGAKFKDLADLLKQRKEVEMKAVTAADFPEDVAALLFALKQNEITQPMRVGNSFCLFQVTAIVQEFTQPLIAVKKEIIEQILDQRRNERYSEMVQKVDRDILNNKTLEEIAEEQGAVIEKAAVSMSSGLVQKSDVVSSKVFLDTAFATELRALSDVVQVTQDTEGFIIRVDEIEPARVKLLDEVKESLTLLWSDEKRREMALEALTNFRENLINNSEQNQDTSKIKLSKNNISLVENYGFDEQELMTVFTTPVQQVTGIMRNNSGNVFFVKVIAFIKPDEAQVLQEMERSAPKLTNQLQEILMLDYLTHLRKIHKIEVFDSALSVSK